MCWAADNLDGYQNFYSCSSDGRVTNWTIVKSTLWHTDQLLLTFNRPLSNRDAEVAHRLLLLLPIYTQIGDLLDGARALAFKPDNPSLFLVGTDEGDIHLATIEYASEHLASYEAHSMPVNSIAWNPFFPEIFLSCAAESLVLVWHKDVRGPILRYNLSGMVGQVGPPGPALPPAPGSLGALQQHRLCSRHRGGQDGRL